MHSNPTKKSFAAGLSILSLFLSSCKQQWLAGYTSGHSLNISLCNTVEGRQTEAWGNKRLMAFRKHCHIYRPELRSHLSTSRLLQIFLNFLTTDGFLTAGSFLVFPWHFSPTSRFICNSRKKNVEVVRSFKMSFVTLKYFHEDKQPKPTCYADNKEHWERCVCTCDAQGGFFLRVQEKKHEAGNSDTFIFLLI